MLTREQVFFGVPAASQRDAVRYLVEQAQRLGKVTDVEAVVSAVLRREEEGTTGFGNGIAIPHGKSNGVREPALLYGRLAEPVDWKAMDGAPVSVLFLILVPEESHQEHLQILAKLARRLMHEEFVQQVKTIADEAALAEFVQRELA
ncbi:PTS sugar transporter subunit IIA [Alicyclobacillus sp.]|uniref:PTS sugar transporter subunit IIA n=1 Tax=Alicyclobacillus sp. TaxID=61169 RepID=UPI0025BC1A14|nr:PTS sugar transporter subunit IIA [Alicyclobacillus sp.]MCL6516116.1 PTS sugar transporter subunit IIA [Alicyclobacillus sp.]